MSLGVFDNFLSTLICRGRDLIIKRYGYDQLLFYGNYPNIKVDARGDGLHESSENVTYPDRVHLSRCAIPMLLRSAQ